MALSVCGGPWMAAEPHEAKKLGGKRAASAAAAFQSMKFSYQQQPALRRPDQPKTKETHSSQATLSESQEYEPSLRNAFPP